MEQNKMIYLLKDRFQIEAGRQDRSGVYALTQRKLAYNSNRIEGSTLTENRQPPFLRRVPSGQTAVSFGLRT